MRAAAQELLRSWRRHGHEIGFGVGISQGYATLGQIGFAERMDYTAIGTVTNLAARLCAEAMSARSPGASLIARSPSNASRWRRCICTPSANVFVAIVQPSRVTRAA